MQNSLIKTNLIIISLIFSSFTLVLGCGSSGGSDTADTSSESNTTEIVISAPENLSEFSGFKIDDGSDFSLSNVTITISGNTSGSYSQPFSNSTTTGSFTYTKTGDSTAILTLNASSISFGSGFTSPASSLTEYSLTFSDSTSGTFSATRTLSSGSSTSSGSFTLL